MTRFKRSPLRSRSEIVVPTRELPRRKLGRRSLLRGMLGGATVALGLPLLEAMLDDEGVQLANGAEIPTRFGVFYWAGGVVPSTWIPSTTGFGWELPDAIQPFENVRDYVTLVTGADHRSSSPGHIPARGIALSSSHDMSVCQGDCVGTYRGQNHPEPSVDALVAETHVGQTAFKSLQVSVCQKGPYRNNSSWEAGGSTYNRHEPSPQAFFDRLFGNFTPPDQDTGLLETTRAYERSMLDAVMADTARLQKRLGRADTLRIEQHLEGLRAIERRLQQVNNGTCTLPDRPVETDFGDGGSNEQKEIKSQLHSQMLAVALACDLTRVFSFEWSATQSGAVYWETGSSKEHHQLTHDAGTGAEHQSVIRFIMKNFAYLGEQLAAQPMAGDNLLDHTLVLGTSEHAVAGNHNYTDHPFLLLGGASGRIQAGKHHRIEGSNRDAPKVLLTAVRAAGVDQAQLGQVGQADRVATESISEIET